MQTRLLRIVLVLAILAPAAVFVAGPSAASPTVRCERNAAGALQCWYVDENGDPWEPPTPPAPLNLVSDDRRVENYGTQCTGEGFTDPCQSYTNYMRPSSPFADFDGSAWAFETGAFQTSHVREDELHLEGNVYKGDDADIYGAFSFSRFNVGFDVEHDAPYRLDWRFDGILYGSDFYMLEDGARIFDWQDGDDYEGQMLFDLVAGRSYSLHFYLASDHTYGYAGADYDITFSAIPEPGTVLLVALGCALIARRRRG